MNKYKRLYIRFLKEEENFSYRTSGVHIFDVLTTSYYLPSTFPFVSLSTRKKFIKYVYPIIIDDLRKIFKGYNIEKNNYYHKLEKALEGGTLHSTLAAFVLNAEPNQNRAKRKFTDLIGKLFNANE